MGSFLAGNQGRQDDEPGSVTESFDLIDDLVETLGRNRLIAMGAVTGADPGVKQAQVIVDFRHGSHGGTGIMSG